MATTLPKPPVNTALDKKAIAARGAAAKGGRAPSRASVDKTYAKNVARIEAKAAKAKTRAPEGPLKAMPVAPAAQTDDHWASVLSRLKAGESPDSVFGGDPVAAQIGLEYAASPYAPPTRAGGPKPSPDAQDSGPANNPAEVLAAMKAAARSRVGQIRLPSGEQWATNPMTIAKGEWNRRAKGGEPTYEELLAIVRALQ